MIESAVAFMEEKFSLSRWPATMAAGFLLWLLGQVTIYSFSGASWTALDWQVPGKQLSSWFDVIDYATSNVLLPLGGLLLAVFAGWVMKSAYSRDELDTHPRVFILWQFVVRWLAPIAIVLIFLQLIGIIQF